MKKPQLELLREIFKDQRTHLAVAKITKVDFQSDRSELRVEVEVWPERAGAVARMTWEQVGPDAGVFGFPVVNDLVIVGIADGNWDQMFVLKRLSSLNDKIPMQASDGSTVIKSLDGKKVKLHSDTRINLGREDSDTDEEIGENVVLGQVFKAHQSKYLQDVADHRHISMPAGYLSLKPDNRQEYLDEKESPVDDEEILSDLSFTEK